MDNKNETHIYPTKQSHDPREDDEEPELMQMLEVYFPRVLVELVYEYTRYRLKELRVEQAISHEDGSMSRSSDWRILNDVKPYWAYMRYKNEQWTMLYAVPDRVRLVRRLKLKPCRNYFLDSEVFGSLENIVRIDITALDDRVIDFYG